MPNEKCLPPPSPSAIVTPSIAVTRIYVWEMLAKFPFVSLRSALSLTTHSQENANGGKPSGKTRIDTRSGQREGAKTGQKENKWAAFHFSFPLHTRTRVSSSRTDVRTSPRRMVINKSGAKSPESKGGLDTDPVTHQRRY